jgi:hypothetical protein
MPARHGQPLSTACWRLQVAARLPGGCHKGELTLVGQQQALELGQWLRARYVEGLGFMPPAYQVGAWAHIS